MYACFEYEKASESIQVHMTTTSVKCELDIPTKLQIIPHIIDQICHSMLTT